MTYKQPYVELHNQDCLEGIKELPDNSIDVILTDPPYLYLKNQKLERKFDEKIFFSECYRVLKPGGFIILFGRGSSFYRWNTLIGSFAECKKTKKRYYNDDIYDKTVKSLFEFKEEIIWNKSHGSSPLMSLTRIHETVSIHSKGKGSINKVKIPYLEMKAHDIGSIIQDIKRMRSVFNNTKSLDAVLAYLENNEMNFNLLDGNKHRLKGESKGSDRVAIVLNTITKGMNEKSIIRSDRHDTDTFTKHNVTSDKRQRGDRCVDVINGVTQGMNEKSIIKQVRDHYTSIHPTQKPVRLLERLLALVIPQNKPRHEIVVADFFAGSFSTGEACVNMGLSCKGWEIDEEYYTSSVERLKAHEPQLTMF